jgi:hypothetical protein
VSAKTNITPAEAARAIFVDYEGNQGRTPTLLGTRVGATVHGVIIEPLFRDCAGRRGASRTAAVSDHAAVLRGLLDRAEREDRLVVSWSQHDLRLMQDALAGDPPRLAQLDRCYRDAKATATRWWWKRHRTAPASGALAFYLKALRFRVPARFGPGRVGDHLRALRPRLEAGATWATLHPALRERWREVVRHNCRSCGNRSLTQVETVLWD